MQINSTCLYWSRVTSHWPLHEKLSEPKRPGSTRPAVPHPRSRGDAHAWILASRGGEHGCGPADRPGIAMDPDEVVGKPRVGRGDLDLRHMTGDALTLGLDR